MAVPKKYTLMLSCLLLVCLGIVLVEVLSYFIISRFTNVKEGHPYHPYLGWVARANSDITMTGHCPGRELAASCGIIKTDEDGHSITPFFQGEPDMTIVVLGGSTMFGAGASSNGTTVPSLLEETINRHTSKKVEVVNLGVCGYQSFQEMLALHRYLRDHPADLILAVTGRNDAESGLDFPEKEAAFLPQSVHFKAALMRHFEDRDGGVAMTLQHVRLILNSYSYTFKLFEKALHYIRIKTTTGEGEVLDEAGKSSDPFANINERVAITSLHNEMMQTITNAHGAEFIMFLQPTAFTKPILTDEERICVASRVVGDQRIDNDLLREYEKRYFARLRTVGKKHQFADITHVFDGESRTVYKDMCHYNDIGAKVVADAIYAEIQRFVED
ncbi:MAG: SGNH/GDSL hydrolase family protein [Deltaproteobacteria bacterium]|nr:SGNH/GDSL hydrolase family protein [Deltaproteobacteria bacterium]